MRGLSWLLTWCSLTVDRPPKRVRKNSSREEGGICALPLIGQCVAKSVGGSIDLREEIDL